MCIRDSVSEVQIPVSVPISSVVERLRTHMSDTVALFIIFYLLLRQMAARHTVIQTRRSYTKIKKKHKTTQK